jgi:hypothetical protein
MMRPLFTELICPSISAASVSFAASTSDAAASAFITEETSNDESNASNDILCSL